MSEVLNNRPQQFNMAIDILALVEVQLKMGEDENKILIDIADQLTAIWKDGRTLGQNETSERVKGLIQEAIDKEGKKTFFYQSMIVRICQELLEKIG